MLNEIIEFGKKCYKCRLNLAPIYSRYCSPCNKIMEQEADFKRFVRDCTRAAVKKGFLRKTPCVKCGEMEVHAHHKDYLRPFNITWLCNTCHQMLHTALKKQ